jgi:hypothetical protein
MTLEAVDCESFKKAVHRAAPAHTSARPRCLHRATDIRNASATS